MSIEKTRLAVLGDPSLTYFPRRLPPREPLLEFSRIARVRLNQTKNGAPRGIKPNYLFWQNVFCSLPFLELSRLMQRLQSAQA